MKTLAFAQQRNQYYNRSRADGPARFGSFGSPPFRDFRYINCRTFQSGAGILPTPFKTCTTPVAKEVVSPPFSPKTPSPTVVSQSGDKRNLKRLAKSSAISVPIDIKIPGNKDYSFNEVSFSERWAGPAYSNSPPPSSLPIPKFSVRPKRTVSLDLPSSASDIDFHPIAKSAPASLTREHKPAINDLFRCADSATKTLRRILNLELADE